jgi:type IV pilus assembly protein PilM
VAFGISKSRTSPIGIDFGGDTLKLLQLSGDASPRVIAAAAAPLPEDSREDPHARLTFYGQKLKPLLDAAPFRGRRVALAIPASQTVQHIIELAATDDSQLENAVQLHMRERLALEPTRMVVRHWPVGEIFRDGHRRRVVVVLAAARDAVMRYVDLAQHAKLEVAGMHAEPTCLLQAAASGVPADGVSLVVDIGAVQTQAMIVADGQMLLAKSIHAGSDAAIRLVARQQSVNFSAARQMRRQTAAIHDHSPAAATAAAAASEPRGILGDLLDDEPDTQTLPATVAPPSAAPAFAPADDDPLTPRLLDELRVMLAYHRRVHADRPVRRLVLLGGEAMQPMTARLLGTSLRLTTCRADPLVSVAGDPTAYHGLKPEEPQPGWAVPLGLCLSPTQA